MDSVDVNNLQDVLSNVWNDFRFLTEFKIADSTDQGVVYERMEEYIIQEDACERYFPFLYGSSYLATEQKDSVMNELKHILTSEDDWDMRFTKIHFITEKCLVNGDKKNIQMALQKMYSDFQITLEMLKNAVKSLSCDSLAQGTKRFIDVECAYDPRKYTEFLYINSIIIEDIQKQIISLLNARRTTETIFLKDITAKNDYSIQSWNNMVDRLKKVFRNISGVDCILIQEK